MLLYDLLKTADIRQIINEDPIKTQLRPMMSCKKINDIKYIRHS